ncbi:TPA: hypothetical protein ACV5PZ_004995 [Escherichia coli]|nr:hypothetical protein [Escherichia coli]HBB2104201.1 hypothetical protein [Escherichia coli]
MAKETTVIKAIIDPALKTEFKDAVQRKDRVLSQVLRDLIREYVWRSSRGKVPASGKEYARPQGDLIRAVIDPALKAEFEGAAKRNGQVPSRALRELIREYVQRHAKGEVWEPGQEIKRRMLAK